MRRGFFPVGRICSLKRTWHNTLSSQDFSFQFYGSVQGEFHHKQPWHLWAYVCMPEEGEVTGADVPHLPQRSDDRLSLPSLSTFWVLIEKEEHFLFPLPTYLPFSDQIDPKPKFTSPWHSEHFLSDGRTFSSSCSQTSGASACLVSWPPFLSSLVPVRCWDL